MNPWVSSVRNEKGVALALALFALVILSVFLFAFLSVSGFEAVIAENHGGSTRALYVAEAGIEHARGTLSSTDIDALLQAGGRLFSNLAFSGGSYTVRVTNNTAPSFPKGKIAADPGGATDDTDGLLVLTSTGSHGGAVRSIEVLVGRPSTWPFAGAAFGRDFLWGQATGAIHGPAGTNGNMTLINTSPKVVGDARAGGTVNDRSYVTGTVTEGAPPVNLPNVDCPAGGYTGSVPPHAKLTHNSSSGNFSINNADPYTLPAGTYYFHDFVKQGRGPLTFTGPTVIYVSGKFEVCCDGFVNSANEPLLAYGCGTDSTPWMLEGDANVWMGLYAPNHPLTLRADGHKYGSFIAQSILKEGLGNLYYDPSVLGGKQSGKFSIVAGSWREV